MEWRLVLLLLDNSAVCGKILLTVRQCFDVMTHVSSVNIFLNDCEDVDRADRLLLIVSNRGT